MTEIDRKIERGTYRERERAREKKDKGLGEKEIDR